MDAAGWNSMGNGETHSAVQSPSKPGEPSELNRTTARSFPKTQLRRLCLSVLDRRLREFEPETLRRSAIVFSPHPDDETLACGGTIIKKKRAGAPLRIVFMTDGRRSHRRFIAEDRLKDIRAQEARAAGRVLGVPEQDLVFLEFRDGELNQNENCAVERAIGLLRDFEPEEVFMPCSRDRLPDHLSTHRIVSSALRQHDRPVVAYEYPVWFWLFYPWAGAPARNWREIVRGARDSCASTFHLLRDFRWANRIDDVLALKRSALEQHRSQMTPLLPEPGWRTLPGVSNGEFLECFFREREIFHCKRYPS